MQWGTQYPDGVLCERRVIFVISPPQKMRRCEAELSLSHMMPRRLSSRIAGPPRAAPVIFSVHHGPSQDPSSAAPELLRIPTHVQGVCAASSMTRSCRD